MFMILRGAKLLMERSDERFTFDFFGTGAKLQRCKSFAKQNSLRMFVSMIQWTNRK